jgi:hypothetical protein
MLHDHPKNNLRIIVKLFVDAYSFLIMIKKNLWGMFIHSVKLSMGSMLFPHHTCSAAACLAGFLYIMGCANL